MMTTKAKPSDLWDTLSRTDPKHTKGFSRAGGFKGTAIKPMWVWQRLTELFGPCGTGWGFGQPTFQVVQSDKETLVYCTVSAWHGDKNNTLWGVGGDKVVTARQSGAFCDDEAFKKAFTDALMNAFKFLGVAADVHMGLFDDNKYVQAMREEFAGGNGHSVEQDSAHPPADRGNSAGLTDAQFAELSTLIETAGADTKGICEFYKITSIKMMTPEMFHHAVQAAKDAIDGQQRKAA
jgi:hypothetical protein